MTSGYIYQQELGLNLFFLAMIGLFWLLDTLHLQEF